MSWREPLWLWLLLAPLLFLLWQFWRKRSQLNTYVDPHLQAWVEVTHHGWKRWLRPLLWCGFWILTVLALAGPQTELALPQHRATPVEQDVYLLVDMSQSMLAEDVSPNRIGRARVELHEFMRLVEKSRIAIIVYAARPHVLVPLTSDVQAADFYLRQLEELPLPTKGSNAVLALEFAREAISKRQKADTPATIYWLTDGDMTEQKQALQEQGQKLAQADIRLNILGIGSEAGALIPKPEGGVIGEFGLNVRSKLNPRMLSRLAEKTDGRFSYASEDQSDWESLYFSAADGSSEDLPDAAQKYWKQWYLWFLTPAVFLLLFLTGLPRHWLPVVLLAASLSPQAMASDAGHEAMKLGEVAYRAAIYEDAIEQFSKAAMQSETDEDRGRALHNLGNSYFYQGEYLSAVQVFEDALTYRPQHEPTLHNLAVAKKVLEHLLQQLRLQQQRARRGAQTGQGRGNGFGRDRRQGGGENQGANAGREPGDSSGGADTALDGDQDPVQSWGSGFGQDLILPEVPVPEEQLETLVGVGLARLSARGINTLEDWRHRNQSLYEARLVLEKLNSQSELLWKRMFEVEEGFPGSLEQPKVVPGLQEW